MRQRVVLGLFIGALLLGAPGAQPRDWILAGPQGVPMYGDPSGRVAWEIMRLQDPGTGVIPGGIRRRELAFAQNLFDQAPVSVGKQRLSEWRFLGPSNLGGRTRALALDIADEQVILAGAVSGGIWRSDDGGANWVQTLDPAQLKSVTSIAQDTRPGKHAVWYAGTGELRGNSASAAGAPYRGDGIYKSYNGGITWQVLESTSTTTPERLDQDMDYIWRVVVDVSNEGQDEVYAATFGGIYRSIDGGETWKKTLGGNGNENINTDLVIDKNGVLYASMSQPGDSAGLWRSSDGEAWVAINPLGWPGSYMRTVAAISPMDENQVYFISHSPGYGKNDHSLWKYTYLSGVGSGTAGGFWEDRSSNLPEFGSFGNEPFTSQEGYDLLIAIHPTVPGTVFIGGTSLYRSTDAFTSSTKIDWIAGYSGSGDNWTGVHHPDQHIIVFSRSNPNVVYSGSDGGIHRTSNILSSSVHWSSLNNGYVTSQFYTITLDHEATASQAALGGTQDNGTWYVENPELTTIGDELFGGDGAYCALLDNGRTRYLSSQRGNIYRFTYDGEGNRISWTRITSSLYDQYLFIHPFMLDPNDQHTMYLPGGRVMLRNNQLNEISEFQANPHSVGWEALQRSAIEGTGVISSLDVSRSNPVHRVYFGTSRGEIYRIDDASNSDYVVRNVTDTSFPSGAYVSSISVHPSDANFVVISYSNYGVNSVYMSENGGDDWTNISGNLEENPDGSGSGPSVRWVEVVGDSFSAPMLFAGTSTGLYSTIELDGANTTWSQEGSAEIGNNIVDMIDFRSSDRYLVLATHGHGLFATHVNPAATVFSVSGTVSENGEGLDGVSLTLRNLDNDETITRRSGSDGRYVMAGLATGSYIIIPEKRGYAFNPDQRSIVITETSVGDVDFQAFSTTPRLAISSYQIVADMPGNSDKRVQAGEYITLSIELENSTLVPVDSLYAIVDVHNDIYLRQNTAYPFPGKIFGWSANVSGENRIMIDPFSLFVSPDAPDGQTLSLPMEFYDFKGDAIGTDTLVLVASGMDTSAPHAFPSDIRLDTIDGAGQEGLLLQTLLYEAGDISNAGVDIMDSNGNTLAFLSLNDANQAGDRVANDRIFTAVVPPLPRGEYQLSIQATDARGNSESSMAIAFSAGALQPTHPLLVVADVDRTWTDPYFDEFVKTIATSGLTFDVWRSWQRGAPPLQLLESYDGVVWFAWNQVDPLDDVERDVIAAFLDNNGHLLLTGDRIAAQLSGAGLQGWLSTYLHATWREHVLADSRIRGLESDTLFTNIDLTYSPHNSEGFDIIEPTPESAAVLYYDSGSGVDRMNTHPLEVCASGQLKSGACVIASPQWGGWHSISDSVAGVWAQHGERRLLFLGFNLGAAGDGESRGRLLTEAVAWLTARDMVVLPSPRLVAPLDGATGVSVDAVFEWAEVPDARSYRFELSATTDFSTLILSEESIPDTRLFVEDLPLGIHIYWRVRARSGASIGEWSNPSVFRTNIAPIVRLPPVSTSGVGGEPLETLSLNDIFFDEDGDALSYVASSSDSTVLRVEVVGDRLEMLPLSIGEASVLMVASDGKGGHAEIGFLVTVPTVVSDTADLSLVPSSFLLHMNYPNPFSERTNITFDLASPARVDIRVFNVMGQVVAMLADKPMAAGRHQLTWQADGLPRGVYFCRMMAGGYVGVIQLVYVR